MKEAMDRPDFTCAKDELTSLLHQHYPADDAIAVVGYACRFSQADDSAAFWRNLLTGRECSERLSRAQLLAAGFDAATVDAANFVNVGSVVKDADAFDAGLFGYAPAEAETMDPQQRLFLQIAWHALEHAGFAPRKVPHRTGVFASARMSTYPGRQTLHVHDVAQVKGLQSLLGNDKDYVATRVAYKLNLRGPALSVQTACSSSLVAVHLACESLRSGDSDMALAGGVAVSFPQQGGYLHQPGMIFSPDGCCRPFDAQANGTFAGNGVAAIVLRRLSDALRAGDRVLAVLPASAINNDGDQKVAYTAPSVAGQEEVIRSAMRQAGIDSAQVGMLEAHGSATPLGDAIELQALRQVFAASDSVCALGSIKGNLGHLDSAAGIASLLKAVLAVQHGVIPPSLHCAQANPALQLERSPFYVPAAAQPWKAEQRIAGVSSFGIGGTNCHVLVSSLPAALQQPAVSAALDSDAAPPLLLSAASEPALRQLAGAYGAALAQSAPRDLAYTALHGRHLDLPCRLALSLVADSAPVLAAYARGQESALLYSGQGEAGQLVWVFPGELAQVARMSEELYRHWPSFAQCVERCLAACDSQFGAALRGVMLEHPGTRQADREYVEPATVVFQLALAAHWQALGLAPHMVLGHGVGEYAAAVVAGHYEIEQIMPLACSRGTLMLPAMHNGSAARKAVRDNFIRQAASLRAASGQVPMLCPGGSITVATLNEEGGRYWRRQIHAPMPLASVLQQASARGAAIFLQFGAGMDHTDWPQQRLIACASAEQTASAQQQSVLLQLYAAGIELDWPRLLAVGGRKVSAPLYAFDTERYWHRPSAPASAALSAGQRVAEQAAASLDLARLQALYDCVTQLHAIYVDQMVRQCVGNAFDGGVSALHILRSGRLLPRYQQLLVRLLNACVSDGYYQRQVKANGEVCYAPLRAVAHGQRQVLQQEFRSYCEGLDVIADTMESAGAQLHAMMNGAIDPVAVIFPEATSRGVEVLYQEFSFGRYFNQIAAGVVAGIVDERSAVEHRRRPLRILEVGGGTGGTTASLLPQLRGLPGLHYDFTDVSALFTRRASEKFSTWNFLHYRQFDLQKSAQEQGFEPAFYDLIVAANVIHAMPHIGRALDNLRPLLRPGGRLLLREITQPMRLFDCVFGPLVPPLQDEAERGGELFLTPDGWRQHCLAAGFERVDFLPAQTSAAIGEHIVLANAPAGNEANAAQVGAVPSSDPLLGQLLSEDGYYLADWSDCAEQPQRWQTRLQQASEELALRHGARQIICVEAIPQPPAQQLAALRLRWLAEPFGWARMRLEACAADGLWYPLTAPQQDLPGAMPAPGTHYDWCWRHALLAPPQPVDTYILPLSAPAELASALQGAGLKLARLGRHRLLLLDAQVSTPQALLAPLLSVLSAQSWQSLIVVTRAAWCVLNEELVQPVQRAAWGLLRVAATEQTQRSIAAIDLSAQADWSELAVGLAALRSGARWVAVRDGEAYEPTLRSQDYAAPPLSALVFRAAGWHLVTGAFGALGRLTIAWLAKYGARRIAIVAPRAHADWPELERSYAREHGCCLRWMPCDVADPVQLEQVLATLQADGGIIGAIHAAGILDDCPLSQLDATRMAAVLALKADAARILRDWLARYQSRYLLLYSSAAAALGTPGQAAHAMASAYLDGLAQERTTSAPLVMALAWGAWGEAGHASQVEVQQALAANGMGLLSNAEGLWHLEQAVMRGTRYRLAMRLLPEHLDASHRALLDTTVASTGEAVQQSTTILAMPALPARDDVAAVGVWLTGRIAKQLRLTEPVDLSLTQDLLQRGLDSLLFLELQSDIERQLGIRLDREQAYRDLSIAGLSALIAAAAPQPQAVALCHDAGAHHAAFPLTPIQHAYWLGRTNLFAYGGVACHVLFEWDLLHQRIDLPRFEAAWNCLIRHHDMLRMVVDADGNQRILPQVPYYQLQRHKLQHLCPAEQHATLQEIRAALSARVLPTARWPLFEIVVSECDEQRYRLHMHLDLLLFDVQSFKIMLDDLARIYHGQKLAPLKISYRDYVLADQARRSQSPWQQSWRYWQERLPQLPPAPRLPLADGHIGVPRFTTYQTRLEADTWSALKQIWQSWAVTPSAALLALFAQTLERHSRQPEFTLNLTFFNRRDDHPHVARLIGDFTSVLLVDFDLRAPQSLRHTIELTQQRLWQHLAHSQVNGVELLRELGRAQSERRQPLMPVVFTSMLGMTLDGMSIDQAITNFLGDPVHVFTQTPQVWLDHQVMEIDGALVLSWYCRQDVLAADCARSMFDDYETLLRGVAAQPQRMNEVALSGLQADGSWRELARRTWTAPQSTLNLRDMEQLLRAQALVRQAQARWCDEDQTVELTLVAEPAPAPVDALAAPLATQALSTLDAQQLQEVEATWYWLDARAQQGMFATLQQQGLFVQPGQAHSIDEIHTCLGALPQYRRLLRQWLQLLAERGLLQRDAEYFVSTAASSPLPPQPLPSALWSRTLGTYLEQCIDAHLALFNGNQSPLALLFGAAECDAIVARTFYRDNPVSQCLHRSAAQMVSTLSECAAPAARWQVLEVGAGTGASTDYLLPALAGRLERYRFTDVSPLFLSEAKQRHSLNTLLDYGLFDLDMPLDFADHPADGYDLIVAVNVLHDARDLPQSLRRLRMLLKPGGHLLMIEATARDSALQLASIGFIENFNAFQDLRCVDEKTLLDLSQWRSLLAQAGFGIAQTWPQSDHTPLRQHLILATAGAQGRLDLEQIRQTLQAHYGAALPALRLRQSERLDSPPTLRPGKASAFAPTCVPQHRHEQEVGALWQELLACPISRDSHFFQSGGDSLIATRMVARLHRSGIAQAALAALFDHPTLADFCATLRPATDAGTTLLLARGKQPQQVFMFHASDGELTAYLPLAIALDCQVHGLQAVALSQATSIDAMAAGYVEALRAVQPKGPYTLIGWSYGAFLAAAAAELLHACGEPVQLVLLDPVCRADFSDTDQASFQASLAQQGLPQARTDDSIAAQAWQERIKQLLNLLVQHHVPTHVAIACLWISAGDRPRHWRAAEDDWHAWAAASQRVTLEADHWGLVMDATMAQQTAAIICKWQQSLTSQGGL